MARLGPVRFGPRAQPFFTNWENYPVGYNFGVNGSLIALGVVFSPITTLFGPIVTWNVLLRLADDRVRLLDVSRAAPLDAMVAGCLRWRSSVRLLGLHAG